MSNLEIPGSGVGWVDNLVESDIYFLFCLYIV
jgi:hypothetical protein